MTKHRDMLLLLGAAALPHAKRMRSQDITGPLPAPHQVLQLRRNAPGVNFYANDMKMTAIGSTTGAESTTGVAYGGGALAASTRRSHPAQYTLPGDCGGNGKGPGHFTVK